MTTPVSETHGTPQARPFQLRGRGKAAKPDVVETVTTHPRVRGQATRVGSHRGKQIADAAEVRSAAVQMRMAGGEREQMEVRID